MVFKTFDAAQYYKNCCHTREYAKQLEVVRCTVYRTGQGWCHYTVVRKPVQARW